MTHCCCMSLPSTVFESSSLKTSRIRTTKTLRLLDLPRKSDLVFQFLRLPENELSSIYYVHSYTLYNDFFIVVSSCALCERKNIERVGGWGKRESEKINQDMANNERFGQLWHFCLWADICYRDRSRPRGKIKSHGSFTMFGEAMVRKLPFIPPKGGGGC